MDCRHLAPGIILLFVKLTGTSLFLVFMPGIFPHGNVSFVHEDNWTVLHTTESLPKVTTNIPVRTTASTTQKAPAAPLPLKWEGYQGSLYWFSETMEIWSGSRIRCKQQNSDLVIIRDKNELEFIFNKTISLEYFIGLSYSEDDRKWEWTDQTELQKNLFTMKQTEVGNECASVMAREVRQTSCFQESHWICKKL
ncbi:C-type lectin domain family 5 member A [Anolis carolinensis]|uniref:C-type lectin domain-containing protein n=1 Tax=Anolis carolinensis TaxID=28377 RepID=A0A803T8N8_ANOCA|nr:PREDICTED: C-type lectin domain family 5 member A [Anolis carolinensis]|eukprot:XP_003224692.1 PREDICTED: C-type lectin domain family 5 member A [Anolis carolinensis]